MATSDPSSAPGVAAPTREGVVRWFSVARGYGFLRALDGHEAEQDLDIFVHHSELPGELLEPGDRLRFSLIAGPRGLQAKGVVRVDPP